MATFKQILVPIDFEAPSKSALQLAVSLAHDCDAKVTLLHVWEIPIYPYMDFMLSSTVTTRVEDAAIRRLGEALATLRQVLPTAESRLRTGPPAPGILETAEQLQADLLLMGTHGRGGLTRLTLGSVAEKVVRASRTPVLMVHAAPIP